MNRALTPKYRTPGKRPANYCSDRNGKPGDYMGVPCNRRKGHGGRHAFVLWGLGGAVRHVWGEKEK